LVGPEFKFHFDVPFSNHIAGLGLIRIFVQNDWPLSTEYGKCCLPCGAKKKKKEVQFIPKKVYIIIACLRKGYYSRGVITDLNWMKMKMNE
jgi:hypothetical protein